MKRPSPAEMVAFEAGIKLGALYHQFIGTPVTPRSAPDLERAMREALEAMPFCERARIAIDRALLRRSLNKFGYTELKGVMLRVEVEVATPRGRARARVVNRNGYPWMELVGARALPRNR